MVNGKLTLTHRKEARLAEGTVQIVPGGDRDGIQPTGDHKARLTGDFVPLSPLRRLLSMTV